MPIYAENMRYAHMCQPGALRIHLTRLSTAGLGPRHGEVRRAHQMLNAALALALYLSRKSLVPSLAAGAVWRVVSK